MNERTSIQLIIIVTIIFSTLSPAQFTKEDRKLAATTFTRNFDKVTEMEYLTSDNSRKVIAGLLSVSISEDTNFVPIIIKLPVEIFAREMCFALGQLGPCSQTADYLSRLFYSENTEPLTRYYALAALGKTVDSSFAIRLVNDYNSADSKTRFNGISTALYYLVSREKLSPEYARPVLEKELYSSSSRIFEAAFCLYRITPAENEKDLLVNVLNRILNRKEINNVSIQPVSYLLGCLRLLQYFPDDLQMLNSLKPSVDFQTEIEVVKSSVFYKFKTREELDSYINYFNNDNKNISREAATSIKNIKLPRELQEYLYLKLSEILQQDTIMEKYTQGELFLSYLSLFQENFNDVFIKFFNDNISSLYRYKACGFYPSSTQALRILNDNYVSASLIDKMTIVESLLNFDQTDSDAGHIFLTALRSDTPPLISITADGIDSSFIRLNEGKLKEIIVSQIENHLNDPDFIEGLMSLETLAERISAELKDRIIGILRTSNLYSVKTFTAQLTGESTLLSRKDIDDFDDYWDETFKYRQAEIITEQGIIKISFLPGFAPISTGSFCYLTEKKFFEDIPFHRVVPGFVIQGGDPTGTGWGGPGYEIVSEFSPVEFNKGMVGMASAGKDTEGSQWFVTTGNYPHLNGRYTIFAEISDGMDIVEKITQDTKIKYVKLLK